MATKNAGNDAVFTSLLEMHKAAQKLKLPPAVTTKGAKAADVCKVYLKIRPVLALVAGFPLIPKKIREAIKLLMSTLDTICPV